MARKAQSKMDKARKVYAKMSAEGKDRQSILKAFQRKSIGLSEAGAKNYYQRIAKEA